jgi:outer membrane protein assembly factor BamE (lipoprotein component of BamABCDE complex)
MKGSEEMITDTMQFDFIPVEDFYFALTLAVRTLEDVEKPGLVEEVRSLLAAKYGQPSTVAPGKQNTFNYVFRIKGVDNSPANELFVSISDVSQKLRLASDYGWVLDAERKPIRTDKFNQRSVFTQQVRSHIQDLLQISLD